VLAGDLVQHLPDVVGDEKHKHTPGVFADHDVAVAPGTRLGSLGDRAPVKSAPPPRAAPSAEALSSPHGPRTERSR
jgi:hypothetical protein